MRPLRYSVNITLDGCVDHRAGSIDEELHQYWAEDVAQTGAMILGRVGGRLSVGGVTLPLALAELGLIDEYTFVVYPRLAGHGPTLLAGLTKYVDLELVSRRDFRSGAVALGYAAKGAS